jgi:putative membrane protein
MIVPRGPQLRRLVGYVGGPLLLLVLYDGAVVLAFKVLGWTWIALPHIPLALFGSSIGLIVAFRNNSSYARWWEARTLWGGIVNNSRSWGRQVLNSMTPLKPGDSEIMRDIQVRMVYLQIAWVHALRAQLRGQSPMDEIKNLLPADELAALEGQRSVSLALQMRQAELAKQVLEHEWIDSLQWSALEATLSDLMDLQGGSERIKNTPMPKQYDYFPRLFVQMYCLMLPLAMVLNMGWYTPLGSTLVGFIFLALDKIGRDLEDPFDNGIYDIPLTAMSRTIEINLRQMLGETELPDPLQPVDGVLW